MSSRAAWAHWAGVRTLWPISRPMSQQAPMKRSMWAMVSSDRAGAGGAVVASAGALAGGVPCTPADGLSAGEGWGAEGAVSADAAASRAGSGSGASSSRSTSKRAEVRRGHSHPRRTAPSRTACPPASRASSAGGRCHGPARASAARCADRHGSARCARCASVRAPRAGRRCRQASGRQFGFRRRARRHGQHFVAGWCHAQHVLPLCRQAVVLGDDRPAIGQLANLAAPAFSIGSMVKIMPGSSLGPVPGRP